MRYVNFELRLQYSARGGKRGDEVKIGCGINQALIFTCQISAMNINSNRKKEKHSCQLSSGNILIQMISSVI